MLIFGLGFVLLRKSNLKINVILNGLEEHMSFTIINKVSFIGSFQFFSSSLDSFVKNLGKDVTESTI